MIPFPQPLLRASFLRRENRFRATLLLDGQQVSAHVPNSGRLGELLVPGAPCYLSSSTDPQRRTPYDLRLVAQGETLVSIDARLPNHLFAEALEEGRLPDFSSYQERQAEARHGDSRLDFLLVDQAGRRLWVETKSVTLIEDATALFPDAPTARGLKHLRALRDIALAGDQAAVVFIIQRDDAARFAPHPKADPTFTHALAEAIGYGVQARAYRCRVTFEGITIAEEVPVHLEPPWDHALGQAAMKGHSGLAEA
jgi:sugar fermentation stimulation protein A